MVTLNTPLTRAINAPAARLLATHRDLHTVEDLLWFLPRRYLDRQTDLESLHIGDPISFVGEVITAATRSMRARRGRMLTATVRTASGQHIDLTFFSAYGHEGRLIPGAHGIFAGQVGRYGGRWQLAHPAYELFGDPTQATPVLPDDSQVFPVYLDVPKLPSFTISRLVQQVLLTVEEPDHPVPTDVRARRHLPSLIEAMRWVHLPQDEQQRHRGLHALKYEEAFVLQTVLARRRAEAARAVALPRVPPADGLLRRFDARLPFQLTTGQERVCEQILHDLRREHPMNRLLQGDVGSGKTVVALRAMLAVVDGGGQAALLAPTEVLAAQHHRSMTSMLGDLAEGGLLGGADQGTRVALLTGSQSTAQRRRALLQVASGEAGIVVGTHALIQDSVHFADLGLVVVDEQHRFGVEQRDALRGKAAAGRSPHVLVMTATPIPRTVAMTVFGDMDTSVLDEVPAGRSPIATHVVDNPRWYERIWERVAEEVQAGHQVYVVCPRIGEQDDDAPVSPDEEMPHPEWEHSEELTDNDTAPRSVVETLTELREHPALAHLNIDLLHGRLSAEEKDARMAAFTAGHLDVLVATTVIEVGVDVPNATVMVILDADRFGVSQLHQLRGRVGRGTAPGLCLLVTRSTTETSRERLAAVASTTDGFDLSRLDLELRREGDVLGARQAGRASSLRVLRIRTDEKVITAARRDAAELVAVDPDLTGHPALAAAAGRMVDAERAAFLERG